MGQDIPCMCKFCPGFLVQEAKNFLHDEVLIVLFVSLYYNYSVRH